MDLLVCVHVHVQYVFLVTFYTNMHGTEFLGNLLSL